MPGIRRANNVTVFIGFCLISDLAVRDIVGYFLPTWLSSLEWVKEEDERMFESYLRLVELINQEISPSNEMIEDIYKKDNDAQFLTTISGIGVTLATLFSTEIDGIERFSSPSKLCSYAGLVPSTRSSGGKTYHGGLTLEGNWWLRWALVEAMVPVSYADTEIRERLNAMRKIKSANVAKTIMAWWKPRTAQ